MEARVEMSDDKKPKKDLRARLGKTIAPTTPGAPPIAIPGVVPGGEGAPVAPPIAAPPVAAPPIAAPQIAAPIFGNDVAPPPFAQPAAPPAEPPRPRPPADPFAAQAHQGPQEVRLVFDDKAVADHEVGRTSTGRTVASIAVSVLVGLGLGAGLASVNTQNALYNTSVRDGRELQEAVNTSTTRITDVQTQVNALLASAAGTPTAAPSVNRAAIQALQALENPFPNATFERKNFREFPDTTVHDLHTYYANIQKIWAGITRLAGLALSDTRQGELARTAPHQAVDLDGGAEMMAQMGTAMFGAVLMAAPAEAGGGVVGQLAFLEPVADNPAQVTVRPSRGGPARQMELWTPEHEIGSNPQYVMRIDNQGSIGVLREQTGAFMQYVTELRALSELVTETIEIQGRLVTNLGEVAALSERFAF